MVDIEKNLTLNIVSEFDEDNSLLSDHIKDLVNWYHTSAMDVLRPSRETKIAKKKTRKIFN